MDKDPVILIAEDEEELRNLYKLRLEYESFKVIFAPNGEAAVERALKDKPDLILLDIMMPQKSGMEVLKELKDRIETSTIPVIMLTVLPHEEVKKQALDLGAIHYLVKSRVTPSEVVKIIKEALNKK